ncbi:tRNA (guanine(9)-N(1))-methyltransferase [Xylographa vitiligo]|nr:tRNA (guanine(9)-N(1))-methyltransferase [Xylographa vitiligo]
MAAEERPSKIRRLSGEFSGGSHAKGAGRDDVGTAVDFNQASKIDAVDGYDMDAQLVDHEPLNLEVKDSTSSSSSISCMPAQELSNESKNMLQSIDENASKKIDDETMDDEEKKNEATNPFQAVFSGLQPDESLTSPQLSKSQLKKLKRKQDWEAGREYRKVRRKEKTQEKKQRKRAATKGEAPASTITLPEATTATEKIESVSSAQGPPKRALVRSVQLPVTVIVDCGFDDLMLDNERISLASQLTRCYSDNHHAPFQFHMAVSSFSGKLKERFETVLSGHHQSWRGVRFLDEDFVEAAEQAKEWMVAPQGGALVGVFAGKASSGLDTEKVVDTGEMETVYLTSDSPEMLTALKPYSTYIIGGIVDRNRHKGICYKRAMDRGMKTARLPIGEYMDMASRFVLATNHVSEIMVKWLELGDWGQAFLKVVPKRKGGVLKGAGAVKTKMIKEEDDADDEVVSRVGLERDD